MATIEPPPPVVVNPLRLAQSPTPGFWQTLAVIIGPLLVCDFCLLPLTVVIKARDTLALIVYGCFGLMVVQGVLLCVAHVLGAGRLLSRTAFAWGWGALAATAWVGGLLVAFAWERWRGPSFRETAAILCSIPLFALAVQTPLWIAHLVFGWRLARGDEDDSPPISIGDLFALTTLAAATLAVTNLGQFLSRTRGDSFWPAVGIAWGITAGVSLVFLLPLAWLVLRWQTPKLATVFSLTVAAAASIVFWAVSAGLNPARMRWNWRMTGISVTLVAVALGTHTGLAILHRYGWRLASGRKSV